MNLKSLDKTQQNKYKTQQNKVTQAYYVLEFLKAKDKEKSLKTVKKCKTTTTVYTEEQRF